MSIRSALPSDLDAITKLYLDSLFSEPEFMNLVAYQYPFRDQYPEDFQKALLEIPRAKLTESSATAINLILEVDGAICGWALWKPRTGLDSRQTVGNLQAKTEADFNQENRAWSQQRSEELAACSKKDNVAFFQGPHWYLSTLIVAKTHQRKGYGRALTQWGMKKAEADGVCCFLSSSVAGEKLYASLGFVVIGLRSVPWKTREEGGEVDTPPAKAMRWM